MMAHGSQVASIFVALIDRLEGDWVFEGRIWNHFELFAVCCGGLTKELKPEVSRHSCQIYPRWIDVQLFNHHCSIDQDALLRFIALYCALFQLLGEGVWPSSCRWPTYRLRLACEIIFTAKSIKPTPSWLIRSVIRGWTSPTGHEALNLVAAENWGLAAAPPATTPLLIAIEIRPALQSKSPPPPENRLKSGGIVLTPAWHEAARKSEFFRSGVMD